MIGMTNAPGAPPVSQVYNATLDIEWGGEAAPYSKTQAINGILQTDQPIIDLIPSEDYALATKEIDAWANVYRAVTGEGTIMFYSTQKPTVGLNIQVRCIRK